MVQGAEGILGWQNLFVCAEKYCTFGNFGAKYGLLVLLESQVELA